LTSHVAHPLRGVRQYIDDIVDDTIVWLVCPEEATQAALVRDVPAPALNAARIIRRNVRHGTSGCDTFQEGEDFFQRSCAQPRRVPY
jgi:hypothetical protein